MARPATAAVRLLTGEREPVRLASTTNITLYGLQTIDGVAVAVGDRVLVKDQADQTRNGIYTASEGQWFRAADARTARTMQKGTTVHVQAGIVSADRVYAFETLDPVIGADPIMLTFYLSQDTLGGAVDAANAAAVSAAAALTSRNAAATSATNAAGSATGAAGSATAASGSATSAATSATNAGNSATAAAGSASAAAGSASSASTSASAAAGSATAASGSATATSGSATSAATSAANAAASAVAAANAVAALGYTFSASTADADPGNGTLRLNNATAALASAAYVDNLDSSGAMVSGMLDTFDDSTNTIKGQLTLRSKANAAIAYVFNVAGPVVDGGGFRKLTLTYISGAGTLPTSPDGIWLIFTHAGDKGADGTGSGDFSGPASSVADNIVTFAGTTGKAGKDSGVAVASLVAGPASALGDNIATFNGTTGKVVKDSGVAVSSFVAGPASAVTDNIATFNGTTGKLVKDGGVAVGSLAPKASPAFSGTPTAPTPAAGDNSTKLATSAYVDTGRLGLVAKTITDWNNALENGLYMASAAANGPDVNWYIGIVEAHGLSAPSLYRTQTVHNFTAAAAANTLAYRRHQFAGVWSAWYKLLLSQTEQDARYVLSSTARLQRFYESAQQTITVNGLITVAHGLGLKPPLYQVYAVCLTADNGYVPGDEVCLSPGHFGTSWGWQDRVDAAYIYIRIGAGLPIIHATSGAGVGMAPSYWRIIVRAWA